MNMKNVLLPVFYLPPVSWFSVFLDAENDVVFEQFENFPKQTYRNRANIYGANGRLSLIIPMNHNGKREMKDIEISYRRLENPSLEVDQDCLSKLSLFRIL